MLKPRNELEKWLVTLFAGLQDKTQKQEYYTQLKDKYNLPIDMSSDILTNRKDLSEYNEFILFAITDIVAKQKINQYFTQREIGTYQWQKLLDNKIKLPISIPMIKVTDDQWIGATSAQFLMQLRDSQYINYNADTQRALQILVRGGKEILRPSVDYRAVGEITSAFADNTFIPNTISLNINPDDNDTEFEFVDNHIVIYNLKYFDIFDGYHRYLAIGRNYDEDKNFDYPMELRITNFSVSKAKQFIFQENHKTKMKKSDELTYNQYDYGNMIIEKLNTDPSCDLYNNINLKDGIVNAGYLSQAINATCFTKGKKYERIEIIRAAKDLKQKLNAFVEENEAYLEKKWTKSETYIILYGISVGADYSRIVSVAENNDELKKIISTKNNITRSVINKLKEVF